MIKDDDPEYKKYLPEILDIPEIGRGILIVIPLFLGGYGVSWLKEEKIPIYFGYQEDFLKIMNKVDEIRGLRKCRSIEEIDTLFYSEPESPEAYNYMEILKDILGAVEPSEWFMKYYDATRNTIFYAFSDFRDKDKSMITIKADWDIWINKKYVNIMDALGDKKVELFGLCLEAFVATVPDIEQFTKPFLLKSFNKLNHFQEALNILSGTIRVGRVNTAFHIGFTGLEHQAHSADAWFLVFDSPSEENNTILP